jgi:hypothetical protein
MGVTIKISEEQGTGNAVGSVFTRTGDVVAENGDYNTGQVTEVADKKYITDAEELLLGNQSGTNTGDETNTSVKTKYEANADTNAFTDSEKTKLGSLESSKFVGEFVSKTALDTAYPTAPIGSYAYVDAGVGSDVEKYIWDNDDVKWVLQQGESTAETPASIKTKYESNADTNAYTNTDKSKVDNLGLLASKDKTALGDYENRSITSLNIGEEAVNTVNLADSAVSNSKISQIVSYGFKGNNTAGPGVEDVRTSNIPIGTPAHNLSIAANGSFVKSLLQIGLTDGDKVDLTVSNNSQDWIINPGAITNTKLTTVPTQTFKGRNTAGTGSPEDLTASEARAILNVEDGATADQTDSEIKIAYESNVDTNAFTDSEKTNLSNQSGTNTGDETTLTIQSKRPLKTVGGTSLEGIGDIPLAAAGQSYTEVNSYASNALANFNSNVLTTVPGMAVTIDRDGNYTITSSININADGNREAEIAISITPISSRTITLRDGTTVAVTAGVPFTYTDQVFGDRMQKNNNQTLQKKFKALGLLIGDIINTQLNTDGTNMDLSNRMVTGYTVNAN